MTITSFTGKIRSGKSLGQLAYALEQCNYKRRILVTNFRLNIKEIIKYCAIKKYGWLAHQFQNGQYIIVDATVDLNKLLSYPQSVVCLDEAGIFLNSRQWQATNQNLIYDLCQSGKDGIDLIYTCQHFDQVDYQMRQLTQFYIVAKGTSIWSAELKKPKLIWKKYFYFDAEDFLAWEKSTHKRNDLKTRWQYAFQTVEGFLKEEDRQLFNCFDSFTRLEKQKQSVHELQHRFFDPFSHSSRNLQYLIQSRPKTSILDKLMRN